MTATATKLKRGTKVEIRSCTGRRDTGVVVKQHSGENSEWFVIKTTDDHGDWSGSVHHTMIRNIDNRPSHA